MGQSTEELNADIARTRSSLSADLDELQDKVSPSAIVDRRTAAARSQARRLRSKVMGSSGGSGASDRRSAAGVAGQVGGDVKERGRDLAESTGERIEGSPLAAGLVAFAAGLVVSALLPSSEAEERAAQQLSDAAKEHGQPVVDEVKSAAADVGDQLKDSAVEKGQELKESAQDSAQTVKEEGESSVSEVKDQTGSSS